MSNLQEYFGARNPVPDRRLQARSFPAALTYVELRETDGGMVLNISETGMGVAVVDGFVVGELLSRIRFPLPFSSQGFEISGQIVWLSESKNAAGIRFLDLTADARSQISHWIESEKSSLEINHLPKSLRRDTHSWDIKPQYGPLPIPVAARNDPNVSTLGSVAEISAGDVPQDLAASFPSEQATDFAREPINTAVPERSESPTPQPAETSTTPPVETLPAESAASTKAEQPATFSPDLIAHTAPQASEPVGSELVTPKVVSPEIVSPEALAAKIMGAWARPHVQGFSEEVLRGKNLQEEESLPEKVDDHIPSPGLGLPGPAVKIESSPDPILDAPLFLYAPEPSARKIAAHRGIGFQLPALGILFAVIGFAVGLTLARGPLGDRFRAPQKSTLAMDTPLSPAANLPAPAEKGSRPERSSAPSHETPPADSAIARRPAASPAASNRSSVSSTQPDSDSSAGASELANGVSPAEKTSKESARSAESSANAPARDSDASPASPAPNGSNGLTASRASENPESELSPSPVAVTSPTAPPGNPAPRSGNPATTPVPYRSHHPAVLVNIPAEGTKPSTVLFPEKPIAVSSSLAITSQLSVVVYPEPGPAEAHASARLQAGDLIFYAEPRYPRSVDRAGVTETVKVRATIGPQGQVVNVKPLSGPASLRSAAISAVREWRYNPTLLNGKPVQAQQDVTIEFRPYH